ncbi:MAG: hypothetical protein JWO82_628 [Akkermansiaceae bacterium]|nr:hypothetical protein [Akkermansiaceae bacterium]
MNKFSQEEAIALDRAQGFRIARYKHLPVVILWRPYKSGKLEVKAYRGKAARPAWHYNLGLRARAEKYVAEWIAAVAKREEYSAACKREKQAKRAALKAADHWTVADVFYNSWGYDQTNVDYYQITHVGKKSVGFRKVSQSTAEECFMSGPTQPRRNEFSGEEIRKNLSPDGSIPMKHGCASKWTGKAVWSSWYA